MVVRMVKDWTAGKLVAAPEEADMVAAKEVAKMEAVVVVALGGTRGVALGPVEWWVEVSKEAREVEEKGQGTAAAALLAALEVGGKMGDMPEGCLAKEREAEGRGGGAREAVTDMGRAVKVVMAEWVAALRAPEMGMAVGAMER